MEGNYKHRHRGRLDLVSFFLFEASGDSEGDFSDYPNVEYSRYHDRYGCHGKSPIGGEADDEDDGDAESCVLGPSRSSSDYNLHDTEDRQEEIVAAEKARHDQRSARDLPATVIDRRRDDDKETSRISDDSITRERDDCYLRDRGKPPCLSDDSIGKSHLHHQHHHYRKFLTEEEKDKLFWEACLAS